MNKGKILLLAAFLILAVCFFALDLQSYLSLEAFRENQKALETFVRESPGLAMGGYALIYTLVTALSLPGAAVMTLAGGALFGLVWGTLIVSVASTCGATLAFLIARFLFRDAVDKRFGDKLETFNRGIEREGAFYLFGLRLVPLFPFFVINLVMGLTAMPAFTFFWVSQVGMFPGTIAYVNAGTQLATVESISGVLSLNIIISFAILGALPLVAKKSLAFLGLRLREKAPGENKKDS